MMTLTRLRLGGAALSVCAAAGLAAAGCSSTGISNPVDAGVIVTDLVAPALDLTKPGPPGPILSDISPRSVSNAGGATLTLRGANFQPGAAVTIGGAACLSPVISSGQITCTAPSRPASCGAVTVVITNPDQQRTTDGTTLAYRSSRFGFLPTSSISSNGNASAVRAIDASGDGKVDLVAAAYASQTLAVHPGNGDGTFKSQPILTQVGSTGSLQPAAAVLDVNGDGKPDVLSAFTVGTGNRFGLFTGVGDGIFSAPASPVDIGSIAPNSIAAGDLDGDGKPDYALALGSFLSTETTVLLYRNSLTPLASATMDSGVRGVTLADLNSDDRLDLLTASRGKGGISVRLNSATGFGVLASYAMGASTNALAVADVNGDFTAPTTNDTQGAPKCERTMAALMSLPKQSLV